MNLRNRRTAALLALGLSGVLLAAGCSSTAKKTTPATTPGTTPVSTPTNSAGSSVDTTTPASTASSDVTVDTSAAGGTTTPPVATGPVYPLTGTPVTDIVKDGRPALVVKVDNHPIARPQSGMNEADIVFEENVEQLTRFALVFQSNDADPVGPIRSGRTQDVNLLGSFNKPLFAWSGGNARVTAAIVNSDLRQISPATNGPFFRTNLPKPHNLYSKTTDLWKLTPAGSAPPLPQFQYRATGGAVAGDDISAVKLSMDGIRVLWQWDANSATFLRFSDGAEHKDALTNKQVTTNNVVVLYVKYVPSPADASSPEAQTTGTGDVWVLSAGKVVKGTWTRADRTSPFTLTDPSGTPIQLTPGRTFVELSRVGKATTVPGGADVNSVDYP